LLACQSHPLFAGSDSSLPGGFLWNRDDRICCFWQNHRIFRARNGARAKLKNRRETVIETIGPSLVKDGLFFVGLDVIGGKLIEVNVTSPTLIQQMSRLTGENLSATVIDKLEEKVKAYRA